MNLLINWHKKKLTKLQKQIEEGNQIIETIKVEIAHLLTQVHDPVIVELFNKVLNYSCSLFFLQNLSNEISLTERKIK